MKCNVGKTERIIRIAIGVLIILIGSYYKNWWGFIGLVPIITGAIGYCPISHALGVSTCSIKDKNN